jgi:transcription antitermination factor NusG
MQDHHPWYAIRVKSKFESVTSVALTGKGYDPFLPVYRARRRWSDRVKQMDLPLFPGYVFCRFNVGTRLPVLTTPGVISVVGYGRNPVPIEEPEIAAIRAIIASGLPAIPWPYLRTGNRVLIECGPLTGIEGIVLSLKNECRLVVSVTMLQRSVSVEIDRDWIRPLAAPLQHRIHSLQPSSDSPDKINVS